MTMPENLAKEFVKHLQAIRSKTTDAIKPEDLQAALQKVNNETANELYNEIVAISQKINVACHNISEEERQKIAKSSIPTANEELDEVVKATEKATNGILNAAETIQKAVEGAPENVKNAVNAQVMQIFEACSFQDITGQRIKKVVSTLFEIEKMVDRIVGKVGAAPATKGAPKPAGSLNPDSERHLMNGPQMRQPTQEEIDKLFSDNK
ncbi:MAG: hypothetical protein EB060_02795 [Proteobacteria bacterium]|nr:hypothetical protein [Pseudomonadota bacterium]